MVLKLHRFFFFLLVLFIPVNLSKHFIFSWSYVNCVLVDYLIPTFYLTDLIILLILVFWDLDLIVNKTKYRFKTKVLPIFLTLLLFLTMLSFSANSPSSLAKLVKYFELALLFLYVGLNFNFRKDFAKVTSLVSASVLFESILGYFQFLKRGSLFNNFLFFGEQPYNFRTPGINYDNLFGVNIIPPYGTFTHPNVFAGFLVFGLTVIL